MKTFISTFILSVSLFSIPSLAQLATADIRIKPTGSFVLKSTEVKGNATLTGDTIEASNIVVGLKNVETGMPLRNEHTKKYLSVDKFPEAILVSAKGSGGKGEGKIKIRGIEKPISGTYTIEGDKLNAEFGIKLSDFEITGIRYLGAGVADDAVIKVTVPIVKGSVAAAKTAAPVEKKSEEAATKETSKGKPAPAKKPGK